MAIVKGAGLVMKAIIEVSLLGVWLLTAVGVFSAPAFLCDDNQPVICFFFF